MNIDRPGPVLCFGEVMLRLATLPGMKLANASSFAVHVGGAEANVAALLAQVGRQVEMITVLPRSPLGDQCERGLRSVGIGTPKTLRVDGRLGLYFFEGGAAGGRVVYDREGSAFARNADAFDWPTLAKNAAWFHVSGINLALGDKVSDSALKAIDAMATAGVPVSFDVNHRASLWESRSASDIDRVKQAMSLADVLFASPQDIARTIGNDGDAFSTFEKLSVLASTERAAGSLSARVQTREGSFATEAAPLGQVVDRIGSGDAFAGAVIDALLSGAAVQECAHVGLAAAVSKHAIAGDRWIGTRDDLEGMNPFASGDVRR